jgi:hypothetical protein
MIHNKKQAKSITNKLMKLTEYVWQDSSYKNMILFHEEEIDILIFLPSKDYPTFSIIKNRNTVTVMDGFQYKR